MYSANCMECIPNVHESEAKHFEYQPVCLRLNKRLPIIRTIICSGRTSCYFQIFFMALLVKIGYDSFFSKLTGNL